MVELLPSKQAVAGSNPVSRSCSTSFCRLDSLYLLPLVDEGVLWYRENSSAASFTQDRANLPSGGPSPKSSDLVPISRPRAA